MNVKIGDLVEAYLFDNTKVLGTVEEFGEKNGRPLVDLDCGHWVYLEQITKIF